MIEVQNLSKFYGSRLAIENLNFKVNTGEVVGLLGPNGAGKSTTMKILTGFMSSTSGQALICGYDVRENPIEVKKRIGYLPENPPVYGDMTVKEYLNFVADLKLVSSKKKVQFLENSLKKTQLNSVQNRRIDNLSKGYKQRVGIAQALVSDPEVLILDEPTVGLDPKQVIEVRELIHQLKGQHTIILSTHILSEVQATCDRVIIINKGQIAAQESLSFLSKIENHSQSFILKTRQKLPIQEFKTYFNFKLELSELNSLMSDHSYRLEIFDIDNEFNLKSETKKNALDEILKACLDKNYGLYEIRPEFQSLEQTFLKLTHDSQEKKSHA